MHSFTCQQCMDMYSMCSAVHVPYCRFFLGQILCEPMAANISVLIFELNCPSLHEIVHSIQCMEIVYSALAWKSFSNKNIPNTTLMHIYM